LKNEQVLTKELIETLIEKIHVYPGKRVEVLFTYSDALMESIGRTSEDIPVLGEISGNSTSYTVGCPKQEFFMAGTKAEE